MLRYAENPGAAFGLFRAAAAPARGARCSTWCPLARCVLITVYYLRLAGAKQERWALGRSCRWCSAGPSATGWIGWPWLRHRLHRGALEGRLHLAVLQRGRQCHRGGGHPPAHRWAGSQERKVSRRAVGERSSGVLPTPDRHPLQHPVRARGALPGRRPAARVRHLGGVAERAWFGGPEDAARSCRPPGSSGRSERSSTASSSRCRSTSACTTRCRPRPSSGARARDSRCTPTA